MGADFEEISGIRGISRRGLLWLAAGAGLAVAAGCEAPRPEPGSVKPQQSSSSPPPVAEATTAAAPAPEPAGTTAVMLCRDAWGAQPARPGGRTQTIERMTLHHSGVALPDNREIVNRLRQHQRYHQDQHGWIDIAYHVCVDHNGNIFELRSPQLVGDTATDYDPTGHFLVLCEGNFEEEPVPEAQLNGAAVVFAWAAQTFHIGSDTLASHRDYSPATECPGANLYSHITSGELKRRIDAVLAAGPVDLSTVCGPDAAQIVAAIEAGP